MQRTTQQRQMILQVLKEENRPLGHLEIFDRVKMIRPNIGIATVYRSIKHFLDTREIVVVELPGVSRRYEVRGKGHHHHFLCNNCETLFEVEGCPGKIQLDPPSGFKVLSHEILLKGICKDCAKITSGN
jgi:Fur family ferric uptake transcriptional regulator